MKRSSIISFVLIVTSTMLVSIAVAEVPQIINYQGRLTDDQGDPVADGDYQIIFQIHDAATGGNILWSSDRVLISVIDGLFERELGPLPENLFSNNPTCYLAIKVEGEDIEPKAQLIAAPYALHSAVADSVTSNDGDWVIDGVNMYSGIYGNVGIGTETPDTRLDVQGKATVGEYNTNLSPWGLVVGYANTASATGSVVLGGMQNEASGAYSVVVGGERNRAVGNYSFVGGGGPRLPGYPDSNTAEGEFSVVGGGRENTAVGECSVVGGGCKNTADGSYSFAGGHDATASHDGCFIWNDDDGTALSTDRSNQFKVGANGGVRFDINSGYYFDFRYQVSVPSYVLQCSNGAKLTSDGVWRDAPKTGAMENLSAIERESLLDKVASMPVGRWINRDDSGEVTSIGPAAKDFYDVFGIGSADGLAASDQAGVALAAIQELNRKNTELEAEVAELKALVARLLEEH